MAGSSRPTPTDTVELSVHNESPDPVVVEAVVHGDRVVFHSLRLDADETGSISAPVGAPVEVHTPDGTAMSVAARGAFFVVRNRRVLVAPE